MNTRRDILKFAGGSALGILFTPAPWRLITDTALWSENWPGIPKPARGEIRTKFTNCTLCPAGCGVRARCVGEQPVSLAGVRGGLCPFGITGHHLPYHPGRLRQGMPTEAAAAVAGGIKSCGPDERVAVLDLRPGRTASWTYRRAMNALRGLYIAPSETAVSVDLAQAKTVLSLGAPL
jgi:menaquinone reductase, molybdopterin-binding-like subunit